ncbi:NUDIX hydrolase [Acidisphaera rubrifaciens]|uniref:Phosphohydrolase/NUDIX hydrolase n=1 Tax=Acidisphaera rubrifaciens HS-AP3 TaxID=1231350 RepID=A0A0D6P2P2_9PROT|nr:NUDIX domain-containing protein [Acidisphaera rubrifaciens]GAN76035.1 phosphohydrolase/NUDIX hydrolase [Acidisphaera rubrifaciens HS-AP3]
MDQPDHPASPPPAVSAPVARARHAASLIVLRRDAAGPSVLMGTRGAGHRFMPNRLVFPGGRVDPADLRVRPAHPLRPDTEAALRRSANPALATALAVAAARELDEETGLTLGEPSRLDQLHYLCRAVTPPGQPIRFNARFLAVEHDVVSGTLAGSGELENLQYYRLDEALAFDLAWVTRRVLEHLQGWLAMNEEERLARARFPVCRRKVWGYE